MLRWTIQQLHILCSSTSSSQYPAQGVWLQWVSHWAAGSHTSCFAWSRHICPNGNRVREVTVHVYGATCAVRYCYGDCNKPFEFPNGWAGKLRLYTANYVNLQSLFSHLWFRFRSFLKLGLLQLELQQKTTSWLVMLLRESIVLVGGMNCNGFPTATITKLVCASCSDDASWSCHHFLEKCVSETACKEKSCFNCNWWSALHMWMVS